MLSTLTFHLKRFTEPSQTLLDLCSGSNGEQLSRQELHDRIKKLLLGDPFIAHALTDINVEDGDDVDHMRRNETPLHLACRNPIMGNDLQAIGLLVEASHHISEHDNQNDHPLQFGFYTAFASPTPARILRIANSRGEMALHVACQNAGYAVSSQVMEYLIRSNPAAVCTATRVISGDSSSGHLPIHEVCVASTLYCVPLEVVALLHQRWPESIQKTNMDGNLPIHLAARIRKREAFTKDVGEQCQADIVQFLVKSWPACLHIRNDSGKTPLQVALDSCKESGNSSAHPVLHSLKPKVHSPTSVRLLDTNLNDLSKEEDEEDENAGAVPIVSLGLVRVDDDLLEGAESGGEEKINEPAEATHGRVKLTKEEKEKALEERRLQNQNSLRRERLSPTYQRSLNNIDEMAGSPDIGRPKITRVALEKKKSLADLFLDELDGESLSDDEDEPVVNKVDQMRKSIDQSFVGLEGMELLLDSDEAEDELEELPMLPRVRLSMHTHSMDDDSKTEQESKSVRPRRRRRRPNGSDSGGTSEEDLAPAPQRRGRARASKDSTFSSMDSIEEFELMNSPAVQSLVSSVPRGGRKPFNPRASARPMSLETQRIAQLQKEAEPIDASQKVNSAIKNMSSLELLRKAYKFEDEKYMPRLPTETSEFVPQKKQRFNMEKYAAARKGSMDLMANLDDDDSNASLSSDSEGEPDHFSTFEQFVVRNGERIKRRINRGDLKKANYENLFHCTNKIKHDYDGILMDVEMEHDIESPEANLRAACHIFQQYLNAVDVVMDFQEIFKKALISEDAFTPIQVVYLDMENILLSKFSDFATIRVQSIKAGQAAQLLSWSETFLEMAKEVCPEIPPSPKWRKYIDNLLQHYLEDGVRKETRELLANLYNNNDNEIRKNTDGYLVTGQPEALMYIYHLQEEVAVEYIPKKYEPAVMGICNEELPRVISNKIVDINENWYEIGEARLCALVNDSTRLSELLEINNDEFFPKYNDIETPLDIEELEYKARLAESELYKLSRAALDRICDKMIHDLHHPVPYLNTVGSLEWETDEQGTAIQVTTTTIREYFKDFEEWLDPNFFGIVSRKCFDLILENYVNYFYKNTLTRGIADLSVASERLIEDYAKLESYFDGSEFQRQDNRTGRLRSKQEILSWLQILISLARIIDPDIKPRNLVADIRTLLESVSCEGDQNAHCILHLAGLRGNLTNEESLNWIKALGRAERAIIKAKEQEKGSKKLNTFLIKLPDLSSSPYIYRVMVSKTDIEKKLLPTTVKYAEKAGKVLLTDYTKKIIAMTKIKTAQVQSGKRGLVGQLINSSSNRGRQSTTPKPCLEDEERQLRLTWTGKIDDASLDFADNELLEI